MSMYIPPIPENKELLALVEKVKAKERLKRYHAWLLNTSGLQGIERGRGIAEFHYRNCVRIWLSAHQPVPSSS